MTEIAREVTENDVDNETRNRAIAAHHLRRLESAQEQTTHQLVITSNWLTASLLAVNGGGALATLNVLGELDSPAWPAVIFAIGLLLALLSAVAIQSLTGRASSLVEPLIKFWQTVEVTGNCDEGEYEELARPVRRLSRWYAIPPTVGWISGIFFFVGAAVLGLDAASPRVATVKVCDTLRIDMLAAMPKRKDSRELFATLKCRPA